MEAESVWFKPPVTAAGQLVANSTLRETPSPPCCRRPLELLPFDPHWSCFPPQPVSEPLVIVTHLTTKSKGASQPHTGLTPRSLWEQHTNIQSACISVFQQFYRNISFNNKLPLHFFCLTDSDRLLLLHFCSDNTAFPFTPFFLPQNIFCLSLFYTLNFTRYYRKLQSDLHLCPTKPLWPWNNADWIHINISKVNILNLVQKRQALDWCWQDFIVSGYNTSSPFEQMTEEAACCSRSAWHSANTVTNKKMLCCRRKWRHPAKRCTNTQHLSCWKTREWDYMLWLYTKLCLQLFLLSSPVVLKWTGTQNPHLPTKKKDSAKIKRLSHCP